MIKWLKNMLFPPPQKEPSKPPEAAEVAEHLEKSRAVLDRAIKAAENNIKIERALAVADIARAHRVIRLTSESVRRVQEAGRR